MADNSLLLSRAKAAALSRDFTMATRLYKQLLASKPDDSEILNSLGNLYIKSGDDDKALPLFRKLSQLQPRNVENLITLGGIYRRLKQYGNSVAVLEQALALGSSNPQVSYNLGFTFKVMGNYDDAVACFEEVVDANPSDVLAYNHIGSIYAAQKNHQQAIETYRRALKVDPNHPVLQLNMARSYEALEEYDKAVRAYELALRSKPGWLEAIDSYTTLLIKLEKVREAFDIVRSALNLNPHDVKMHTKMGDVYARQSVYSNAAKEYQSALETDETFEPALLGLSDSQEHLGYSLDAAKNIEKVVENHPDDEELLKRATGVLLSAGDFTGAFHRIDRLWEKNPRDLETISLLGQYYICMNKVAKAEKCFSRIKSLNNAYSDHLREAAKRFRQKGDLLNAEKYYRAAIEKNPRDVKSMVALARLLEEQSQGDTALELYKRASRLDRYNMAAKNGVKRLQEGYDEDGFMGGFDGDDLGLENAGVVRAVTDVEQEAAEEVDLNADFEDNEAGDEIELDDFDDSDFAPSSELEDDVIDSDDDLLEKEEEAVPEEVTLPAMEEAAREELEDPLAFADSDDPLLNEKDDLIDLLDDDGGATGVEDKTLIGEKTDEFDGASAEDSPADFGSGAGTGASSASWKDSARGADGASGAASFDDFDTSTDAEDGGIDLTPDMDEELELDIQPKKKPVYRAPGVQTVYVDSGSISRGLEEIQEQLKSASEAAEKANAAAQRAWDYANDAEDAAQAAEEARRQSLDTTGEEYAPSLEDEEAQWEHEMALAQQESMDSDPEPEENDEDQQPEDSPDASSQISLLKKLLSLTEFLPESKQNEFGISAQKRRLDTLISRLSELED